MSMEGWIRTRDQLVERLRSLADGEALILGEPVQPAPDGPRKGILRRRPRPEPVRFVQFIRIRDDLCCDCVGPHYRETSTEEDAALRAEGWHHPDETDVHSGNYEYWVPFTDDGIATAADLGIRALQTLSTPVDALEWTSVDA